jgi:peptidoglycan/LPS O-acetylase OafA/YrhL
MDRSSKPHLHLAYRPEIDGLRAIAILLVILFHLFPHLLPGGFIGVDVFFVISGYLITSLIIQRHQRGHFTIASFYQARICRLFPALLLVLLSSIVWGWLFLLPIDYARLGRHIASTMGFFENFTLKRESGYFDADIKLKPLAHMWSLSIEEQFYLMFPLLIMMVRANPLASKIIIASLGLISLGLSIWGVHTHPIGAYFLPWMRAWELLMGATLFFMPNAHRILSASSLNGLSIIALALVIGSALLLDAQTPFPGAAALAPVLGAALIIWLGHHASVSRWLLANPVMTGIGLISYPLYLWHWPLLSFLHLWPGERMNEWTTGGVGLLALLLATATYHGVEKPLKAHRHRPIMLKTLLGFAIGIAIAGVTLSRTKGFPLRYPELPIELSIEKPPFPKGWRFGECFLLDHQAFSDFSPECFESASPSSVAEGHKKRVLLWGDSYAAQLYPGLAAHWKDHAEITQLTAMACAPFIDFSLREYPHCPDITHRVIEHLETHHYDTVMVVANWDGLLKHNRHQSFEDTLKALRERGVKNLVIYGPPPHWNKDLPKLLLDDYVRNNEKSFPERMTLGLDGRTAANEAWLIALSKHYHIGYVSIYKRLCNNEGCLVRINQNLTSMDDGHLTESASRFIFNDIQNLNGDP